MLRPDLVDDRRQSRAGFCELLLLEIVRFLEVIGAVGEGDRPLPGTGLGELQVRQRLLRLQHGVARPGGGPVFNRAGFGGQRLGRVDQRLRSRGA